VTLAELIQAVWAVVTFTRGNQVAAQHLNDAPMRFHAGHDRLLVALGQGANFAARSPLIATKIKQLVDLLDRKPRDRARLMKRSSCTLRSSKIR
jgi:hypothetical protein